MIDENKKKIVIDNYFKSECNANILEAYVKTMKETYAKGFERGLSKASVPKPKIGKWIYFDTDDERYDDIQCSVCKKSFTVDSERFCDIGFTVEDLKFCPNCGARMEDDNDKCRKI